VDARVRLGKLLIRRRIELSSRYRDRTLFAHERLDDKWRTLHDLELAKRPNFRPETLEAVEAAYEWQPGSIERVLAGGDPLPRRAPEELAQPVGRKPFADPAAEALARAIEERFPALLPSDVVTIVENTRLIEAGRRAAFDANGRPA
jgi:hypothetical protein